MYETIRKIQHKMAFDRRLSAREKSGVFPPEDPLQPDVLTGHDVSRIGAARRIGARNQLIVGCLNDSGEMQ
jgi:hypothetical protein